MAARPLVVIGDANPDLVLRGDVVPRFGQAEQLLDSADLVMGGSASIMACGAARLGLATSIVARVGDDAFGRFVTQGLVDAGVDVARLQIDPRGATGLSVILSSVADRAILTHLGVLPTVQAGDLDVDSLPRDAHVHAASYFLLPELAAGLTDLFRIVRARGGTTSLDTNWDPAEQWLGVHDVLAHTDVFLPNEAELCAVAGTADVDHAARSLAALGCAVAVKRGGDGGSVWLPSGERHDAPIVAVDVVDTTGAGDSFDGGYLAAMLRGHEPEVAIRCAAAAGSLSTRGRGGTAAQATWAEITRHVDLAVGQPG